VKTAHHPLKYSALYSGTKKFSDKAVMQQDT